MSAELDKPDPVQAWRNGSNLNFDDGSTGTARTAEQLAQWCDYMYGGGHDFVNTASGKWSAIAAQLRKGDALCAEVERLRFNSELYREAAIANEAALARVNALVKVARMDGNLACSIATDTLGDPVFAAPREGCTCAVCALAAYAETLE